MNHPFPATPGTLRERFVQDMTVRGFTDKTCHDTIRTVAGFAAFLERSPSTATAEDIRRFQIQQSERGMNAPAMNSAVATLRFFFNHTADRPDLARKLIRLRYPRLGDRVRDHRCLAIQAFRFDRARRGTVPDPAACGPLGRPSRDRIGIRVKSDHTCPTTSRRRPAR